MNQEDGHNPQSNRVVHACAFVVLIIVRAELATANKKGLLHVFAKHWHLVLLVLQDELLRFLLELRDWITHHHLCKSVPHSQMNLPDLPCISGQKRVNATSFVVGSVVVSCTYVDMCIRPLLSS